MQSLFIVLEGGLTSHSACDNMATLWLASVASRRQVEEEEATSRQHHRRGHQLAAACEAPCEELHPSPFPVAAVTRLHMRHSPPSGSRSREQKQKQKQKQRTKTPPPPMIDPLRSSSSLSPLLACGAAFGRPTTEHGHSRLDRSHRGPCPLIPCQWVGTVALTGRASPSIEFQLSPMDSF
ncbi:hypothetical protein MUK42_32712 [Musa troglodytarum]|uniref:Uncharacterized protein n=1 Tax=Musa troglodytarum TaxID=320322 RepID=A0A9E7FC12_9LILI|nr:hypothetical protein MUK42_32712 [Musa troglodytarum]